MAKAPASDQRQLLKVQDLDTQLQQLEHRQRTLPGLAQLAAIDAELTEKESVAATQRAEASDVRRELAKAEGDVEQVVGREQRDRERLDAGQGNAKDLQGLQSELEALAKRRAELEDVQFEIMERLDTAENELASTEGEVAELRARRSATAAELEGAIAEIDLELARLTEQRKELATDLDAGLMKLYDRLREQSGGVGAAVLRAGRCEGCRLELNAGDLSAIRAAAEDDIVRCEECGRILVREQ